jgi:hypothetical protein
LTGGSGLKKEEEKGWKKVGFFDDDDDVRGINPSNYWREPLIKDTRLQ